MFITPDFKTFRAQMLGDLQAASFAEHGFMPHAVLKEIANATANIAYCSVQYLDYIALQVTPATATDQYLEMWGQVRGVMRRDAAQAHGTVVFTGTAGTTIPAGTVVSRIDGITFRTTEAGVVGASIPVVSESGGAITNTAAGTTVNRVTMILGVNPVATVGVIGISGGADMEDDEDLRTRVLAAWRNSAQGGSEPDYVGWTMEVPGVTRAWAVGRGMGHGTVTVYPMFDDNTLTNGFPTGADGVATREDGWNTKATGDLLEVANHLYDERPITAMVFVIAPKPLHIPVNITGLSPNTAAVRERIVASLRQLSRDMGSPLGMTVHPSDIIGAVRAAVGQGAAVVTTPLSPITVQRGYLPIITASDVTFI